MCPRRGGLLEGQRLSLGRTHGRHTEPAGPPSIHVMAFVAHVLNVFIASPGDTSEFRDAVEAALHRWNGMRSANAGVVLLPRRWEVDGVPLMGGDGQSQLNSQLVDKADIVIGIFHTRLGKETPRGRSGTAEEIERTHAAGKPVHIYRSTAPMPSDVDTKQIEDLRAFLSEMQRDGLTGSFATSEDLQNQVHAAIELDVATLGLAKAARDELVWRNEEYTVTSEDVAADSFTFPLSYLPVPGSLTAFWGPLMQPPSEYLVSDEGVITWDLGGYVQTGDAFRFQYQSVTGG